MCFATTRSVGRDFLQVTGALGVVVNRNGILTTQRLFGKDVLLTITSWPDRTFIGHTLPAFIPVPQY